MQQTMADAGRSLLQIVDVRSWTKQYPLISLGSAAAAGFAAGMFVTPAQEQTLKERWADLAEQVKHLRRRAEAEQVQVISEQAPREKPSWTGSLVGHLADIAKAAVTSSLAAAVAGRAQQSDGLHDGHEPPSA